MAEICKIIYVASRDGLLYCLQELLDDKSEEAAARLVSARTNGATPLLMACTNGHLGIALLLIQVYRADIDQVGTLLFDGEVVEEATPLWCSAAAGHFKLVKMLVRLKASLNSSTSTNSTPLRAACYGGHFDIVKYLIKHGADVEIPNKHGHTCLMIAAYKGYYQISEYLIECGADVNRKSVSGSTALHYCAESGHIAIMKLLVNNGATFDTDSTGATPLLCAAVTGHITIVEHFIKNFCCTKKEIIDVLELLGATLMDKNHDMILTFHYWKLAMEIRNAEETHVLDKPSPSPFASYIDEFEVQTFQELEDLLTNSDKMKMQSLLIRERILGPGHPDTLFFLNLRGEMYFNEGNLERCIQLWMYALNFLQEMKLYSSIICHFFISFVNLFIDITIEGNQKISYRDIVSVFVKIVYEIDRYQKQNCNSKVALKIENRLILAMLLLHFACNIQPENNSEELTLKKAVYNLVYLNPRCRDGKTVLHMACCESQSEVGIHSVTTVPSSKVVNLLLEVGAYPNSLDLCHNTPLHIAAKSRDCCPEIFDALLNKGAHLDQANKKRKTALALARKKNLKVYALRHINLQCLCAKTIKKNNLIYKDDKVISKNLVEFLDVH